MKEFILCLIFSGLSLCHIFFTAFLQWPYRCFGLWLDYNRWWSVSGHALQFCVTNTRTHTFSVLDPWYVVTGINKTTTASCRIRLGVCLIKIWIVSIALQMLQKRHNFKIFPLYFCIQCTVQGPYMECTVLYERVYMTLWNCWMTL